MHVLVRTSKLPKSITTDSVKGLCEVYECCVRVTVLFLTFFQQVSCREYHVNCSATLYESTLGFWKMSVLYVLDGAVEVYPAGKNFADYYKERNSPNFVCSLLLIEL